MATYLHAPTIFEYTYTVTAADVEAGQIESTMTIKKNGEAYAYDPVFGDILSFTVKTSASDILGDANLDGEVDITDATTIQRYDVKMINLSETSLRLADVDGDNEVSILDATWIQRWELNMKAPEGIGEPIAA